jgi:hypothetical protein
MADPTKVDINEGKAAAPVQQQPTQAQRDQNEAERARVDSGKDAGGTAGGANPNEPGHVHPNHLNMKEHNERELERRKRIDEHNAAGHAKNMKAIEETAKAAHENSKKGNGPGGLPEGMGMEVDVNTPRVDPETGAKDWNRP